MSKKINAKNIKAERNKVFNKKRKVAITSEYGEVYDVIYDESISLVKLSSLVEDLLIRMRILNEYKIKYDYTSIVYMLVIKYFTDIDFPEMHTENKNEVEASFQDELSMLEGMLDLGIYEQVVNNFTEDNLVKIKGFLDEFVNSDKYKEMANLDITNIINQLVIMLSEDGSLGENVVDYDEYKDLEETMKDLSNIVEVD